MTNPDFRLLMQHLSGEKKTLLIADENLRDTPLAMLPDDVVVLSNRFDLHQQACAAGLNAHFSDFDFSVFPQQHFDQILYRVSKEKPVVHHIINHAKKLLATGGELVLVGGKNEGLKTYAKKAGEYFSGDTKSLKQGQLYSAIIIKHDTSEGAALDDKDYAELRPEITVNNLSFYSKPGVFGWDKVDQGSAFLVELLAEFLQLFPQPPKNILDLGCGYGHLSVMLHQQLPTAVITATDNNAAAIEACKKNFQQHNVSGAVIAADCAEHISGSFDAVICNPPFHQGFDTDGRLTDRFIQASHNCLASGGRALFVVNRFVPLERKAEAVFNRAKLMAENRGFKIILLQK